MGIRGVHDSNAFQYRLPVPGLWLDIFQKVKALGFNAVSFYTHWALLEGEEGVYRADGVFALEPFFSAASEAGIYLIARPGPYINAESSGGGFPGWYAYSHFEHHYPGVPTFVESIPPRKHRKIQCDRIFLDGSTHLPVYKDMLTL